MNVLPAVVEWFRDAPLPQFMPDPVIVTGGTGLLREFFAIVAGAGHAGQLWIAVPFVHVAGRDLAVLKMLPHQRIDLSVVTSGRAQAAQLMAEIGELPWRSLQARTHARLHAKLYAFADARGGGACLIGSHNLTSGGARTHSEAGVLFRTSGDPQVSAIVNGCCEQIARLMNESELFRDTLRWAASPAQ